MSDPFAGLPRNHFGAILADPPWKFLTLWKTDTGPGNRNADYPTMDIHEIAALPVESLAAPDCVLFIWGIWILLPRVFGIIEAWGFEYKTCAFDWMKAHNGQIDMFRDDADVQMGLGYWTRANSEPCLLATRGKPKRLNADIRQGIIAPRREHSRKPDGIHERIERLVAGPYLELFARQKRAGWTVWGNETDKFDPIDDISKSVAVGFEAIRERKANGGPGWGGSRMTLAPFHIPDPITITLDLPMPPSTNQIWRRSAKTGMHLSKDFKAWKVQCDRHLVMTRTYPKGCTIHGPCEAHILLNLSMARSGSDIDNRVKAVLDYVQRIELLDNDKLVMKLTVEWAKPSAAPVGCRVTLTELAG